MKRIVSKNTETTISRDKKKESLVFIYTVWEMSGTNFNFD